MQEHHAESVKMRIFNALVELMEEQPFREITVTAIVHRAGVSRMAFYRAYSSKEEVISDWVDEIIENYYIYSNLAHNEDHHISMRNIMQLFALYKANSRYVLLFDDAKLSRYIYDAVSAYLQQYFINAGGDQRRAYILEMYSGALYLAAIKWLRGGMKEPMEELAQTVYDVFAEYV